MGRGNVISKETIESNPGCYPVFSSSATGDGIIGHYAEYMFDDERISWSIDGGGKFFYHPISRYSVTNVSGWIKVHKQDEISTRFLYLALDAEWQTKHFDYQTKAHPSVIKNEYTVIYPAIDKQHEITTTIASCENHIAALQALITKYEAIKKATVKLLLEPKEGWQRLQIKDFAQVYDGTHQTPHYTKSGIPFFSVENVTTNVFPGDKRISLREHRKLTAKFKIRRGDVLMTRIGSIGECRLVDWDYDSSFYVSLAALRFKPNLVLPEYFVTYSTSGNFQEEVNIHSLPFAVPQKINLGPISDIYVSAPPLNEQRKIAARISAIDDALKDCRAQLAKAKSLKQGMMSYFFG